MFVSIALFPFSLWPFHLKVWYRPPAWSAPNSVFHLLPQRRCLCIIPSTDGSFSVHQLKLRPPNCSQCSFVPKPHPDVQVGLLALLPTGTLPSYSWEQCHWSRGLLPRSSQSQAGFTRLFWNSAFPQELEWSFHSTSRIMLVLHPKLQLILILIRVEVLSCPITFLSSFPAIFSSSLPGAQHTGLLPAIFSPHHACGQLFHALVWLWSIFTRPVWSRLGPQLGILGQWEQLYKGHYGRGFADKGPVGSPASLIWTPAWGTLSGWATCPHFTQHKPRSNGRITNHGLEALNLFLF